MREDSKRLDMTEIESRLNELKDRRYFRKPSLKRRLKREDAVRQRVKDMKKDIKAAMRDQENWMN